MKLHRFLRLLFAPISALLWPKRVTGRRNLPKPGTPFVLVVSPHLSEFESFLLSVTLWRYNTHFYAKAEYWQKHRRLGKLLTALGQIPAYRKGREMLKTIQGGVEVLVNGDVLVVYAQGTRSPKEHDANGRRIVHAYRGHDGAVTTAQRASKVLKHEVSVIPVGIRGMEKLNPSGKGLLVRPRGGLWIAIGRRHSPFGQHSKIVTFIEDHLHIPHGTAQTVTDDVVREAAALVDVHYLHETLPLPD